MKPLQQDTKIFEQIIYNLTMNNQNAIAFLIYKTTIYYSSHTHIPKTPITAITKLIQGVYDSNPETAHFILRNRIYSSAIPTEMCIGMIKVAAKRYQAPFEGKNHHITIPLNMIEISYKNTNISNIFQNKLIKNNYLTNNISGFLNLIKKLSEFTIQKKNFMNQIEKLLAFLFLKTIRFLPLV